MEDKAINGYNRFICLWNRGVIFVLIYRLKCYCYHKQSLVFKLLLRLLKYPEFHLCHGEIDPRAEIGPGLVIHNMGGVSLGYSVIIGKNCTFMGKATPTLGAMEGIAMSDRIRIGDDCVIGPNVRIINPVTIANGVQIKANSVLMVSVKQDGTLVAGFPAKKINVLDLNAVKVWSPLLSRPLTR